MHHSSIAIILLNYNTSQLTLHCVESIRNHTQWPNYEIVVVDNNSRYEEYLKLEPLRGTPNLTLVRSRINLGFSGGNMMGVQYANPETDYYYFLNNDCLLLNDVCTILATFMEQHPNAGIVGAQMFKPNRELRYSFGYFPSLGLKYLGHGFMKWYRPEQHPALKAYQEPLEVPFIMGSTLFIRATDFREVSGFDITHFLYVEEEDLARKMHAIGKVLYLIPEAEYIHLEGQSTAPCYEIIREYHISLFHYFRKHHSYPAVVLFQLFYAFKNGKKFYKHRNFSRLALFILKGCPMGESLRYRQKISIQ